MKNIILTLFCIVTLNSYSQVCWYKANSYAYKQMNNYGYWTNWSNWIPCNIDLKIDWDNDIIVIYSNKVQKYIVTDIVGNYTDSSNGKIAEFKVIDQDYDYGNIRLRIEQNGNSQIYIDFANIMWVYNIGVR